MRFFFYNPQDLKAARFCGGLGPILSGAANVLDWGQAPFVSNPKSKGFLMLVCEPVWIPTDTHFVEKSLYQKIERFLVRLKTMLKMKRIRELQ